MRKQKTFDYLSEAVRFIESISTAHDLKSASLKLVSTTKNLWRTDERWRAVVNYK